MESKCIGSDRKGVPEMVNSDTRSKGNILKKIVKQAGFYVPSVLAIWLNYFDL